MESTQRNDVAHRLEVETSLGAINVLKSQLEEKVNEANKFQEIIQELVASQKPYQDTTPTTNNTENDIKIKDFEYIQKKIDGVRQKIDTLLSNNNNNNNDLAILFKELNSLTTQLTENMVNQIAEERRYSYDILTKFNEELANQDVILETMNDLTHQHTLISHEKRFSFLAPENNLHLLSNLVQPK